MSVPPARALNHNTPVFSSKDIQHDSTFTSSTREGLALSSSRAPTGIFAGASNTDARYSTFNDVTGNQYITNVNQASQPEKILATLNPVERSGCYVSQCMKGTREDVFKNIDRWLDDVHTPNVLWLSGCPGAGKSTIASSLVSRLTRRHRIGSSFFFRRGDVTLSDPAALWRTVAYDLAQADSTFAKILIRVLEQREVDPKRPDIASHFQYLIQEPLMECYNHSPSHTNPVILVDALDECDSDRSQVAQRKVLLDTLTQWSQLPRTHKLIVTGRDDRVPESFRAVCKRIALPTGGDVSADANNDIRLFFEERFTELAGLSSPEWPGKQMIDVLTTRAAGLFIWAETVMKFVEQGFPDERLKLVLEGELGGSDNLTKLYRQILELSFQGIRDSELEISRLIIAIIVLAKVPLHYDNLHDFVSQPKLSVRFVLDRLSSVISSEGADKRLRICHLSFSEFLCDHKRCPKQFCIDRGTQSMDFALACFRLMKDGLKFNICNLETSHVFNDDVPDLPFRIKTNIPDPLLYSCSFWAAHLQDTTMDDHRQGILINEVKDFLHHRFLYWLEVMSLRKGISAANIALLTAVGWIEMFDAKLGDFARDARQFILTFDTPISLSAPHIYLSALPFSPFQSLVARQYQSQFGNTLSVVSGFSKNWPAVVNILRGHTDKVCSVAYSPDGKQVVSGSYDKTIRIWDAETGEIVAGPFKGHTNQVFSVAFSSDGKRVVSGSFDKTIRIWNAETGEIIAGPFKGHLEEVISVSISPDGKRVVSGSFDKTICVWDAETGEIVAGPLEGHMEEITSVAFSQDGRRVVSGSFDKTVRIWDSVTGEIVAGPFKGHTKQVTSVGFSPDGKRIVSGSFDKTIRIWDAESGEIIAGPFRGHTKEIKSVAFSPNGKRVVSGSMDETIRIWDAETGQIVIGPFEGHTRLVHSVAFSPDGKRVISGSFDKTIRIWDAETSQTNAGPFACLVKEIFSVAFSLDGKQVVSGSLDAIHVWDAESGEMVAGPFKGHTKQVKSVAFSPDGKRVVSGSLKTIHIWDAEIGEIVAGPFEGHTKEVPSVAFSPDGKRVVSGSFDKTIRIWDAETGEIVAGPFEGHTEEVFSVAFSPDGKQVVSGSFDKTIRVWDAETGEMLAGPLEGHMKDVVSVAFSPDGKRVVSGSEDKTIRIWDAESIQMSSPFAGQMGSDLNTPSIWDAKTPPIYFSHMRNHLDVIRSIGGGRSLSPLRIEKSHGWVVLADSGGEGLGFWVPPPCRGGLCGVETLVVFGQHTTRLDLSQFVHGTAWTQCRTPSPIAAPSL